MKACFTITFAQWNEFTNITVNTQVTFNTKYEFTNKYRDKKNLSMTISYKILKKNLLSCGFLILALTKKTRNGKKY